MGKRGPAPRPTALRLLQGDRSDRINRNEPVPAPTTPTPPDYLDADARAVWDELAVDHFAKVGVTHWDSIALGVYCTSVVLHRRAAATINQTGVLLRNRGDHGDALVKHPALQIVRDQAAIIRAFGAEFGLTPSSRQTLTGPTAPEASPADRLLS